MLTTLLPLLTSILLSAALTIPSPPSLYLPTFTPWPPLPHRVSISTTLPLTLTLTRYGPPGPPNPTATLLLQTLSQNLSRGGPSTDHIGNHTESTAGAVGRFTAVKDVEGYEGGITRLQAQAVVWRIWGLTILHGAVGVGGEVEVKGRVVERFELEYRFEGVE